MLGARMIGGGIVLPGRGDDLFFFGLGSTSEGRLTCSLTTCFVLGGRGISLGFGRIGIDLGFGGVGVSRGLCRGVRDRAMEGKRTRQELARWGAAWGGTLGQHKVDESGGGVPDS